MAKEFKIKYTKCAERKKKILKKTPIALATKNKIKNVNKELVKIFFY